MIDKIWYDWQKLDSTGRRSSTTFGTAGQSVSDLMPPWQVPVSGYMDTDKLCYSYSAGVTTSSGTLARRDTTDSFVKPASNGYFSFADLDKYPTLPEDIFNDTKDRSDLYRIRIPDPMPEWYLKMSKANITEVRELEESLAQVVINENKLSRLSSYRSPACLSRVNRQVFVPLSGQQTSSDWLINFSGSAGPSSLVRNSGNVVDSWKKMWSLSICTTSLLFLFV